MAIPAGSDRGPCTECPALFAKLGERLQEWENNGFFKDIFPENANPLTQLTDYLNQGFTFLTNYIMNLFSFVSSFAIVLFTFPIMLYYMLKEGGKFGEMIVSFCLTDSRK